MVMKYLCAVALPKSFRLFHFVFLASTSRLGFLSHAVVREVFPFSAMRLLSVGCKDADKGVVID